MTEQRSHSGIGCDKLSCMTHEDHLLQALNLAALGKGHCAPNPAVGAVVVNNGQIVGQGYHRAAGTPHAEIHAIREAGATSQGASLYVTLEPCCHHGRTPPCTEAILAAGIRHVYFGHLDPNPHVAGKGQAWLREQGITCELLPFAAIDNFYRSYDHWTLQHTPWITAKLALSLDGKIAGPAGQPAAITRSALQIFTHQRRRHADAILTSVRTVLYDDPRLNVRLHDQIIPKKIYVLDRKLRFPSHAKLLQTATDITVFYEATSDHAALARVTDLGIRCISLPCAHNRLDLAAARFYIGRDGIHDLWVEAGGQVFTSLLHARLLNEAYLYVALKSLGAEATSAFTTPLDFMQYFQEVSVSLQDSDLVCHLRQ